jgi:hypothetical protein
VIVTAEVLNLVQAASIARRVSGEVVFSSVLPQRGILMRSQDPFGRNLGVIEQPIHSDGRISAGAGRIDAGLRLRGQRLQHLHASLMQPPGRHGVDSEEVSAARAWAVRNPPVVDSPAAHGTNRSSGEDSLIISDARDEASRRRLVAPI